MNQQKGFTLVEAIVVLAVIAILASIAVPMALRIFEITADEGTREEMQNIKAAMIGNPKKLQGSFRSDFGFLGDIGCLPTTLERLLTPGTLTTPFVFITAIQTGAGWNGPYITGAAVGEQIEELTTDQLGNVYTYTPSSNPSAECPLDAILTSSGPDGAPSTSDDITLQILPIETTATVRGLVKDLGENPLADASVDVNYASIGGPFTQTVTTDSNGIYFATVPFGHRSVQISSSGSSFGLVPGSVTVTGFNDVNFNVVNDSSSPVTVTHMTIDCAGTGATRSAAIDIGGQQVNGGDNIACLTQRSVSGAETTFAANPPPTPLRIVADSPDAQLPDLTLGAGGDTKTITLNDFEISGGGGNPNVDMSGGKTLTVTFFSSASTEIAAITVVTP